MFNFSVIFFYDISFQQMVLVKTNRMHIIGRQDMEIYFSQENANEELFSSFRAVSYIY